MCERLDITTATPPSQAGPFFAPAIIGKIKDIIPKSVFFLGFGGGGR